MAALLYLARQTSLLKAASKFALMPEPMTYIYKPTIFLGPDAPSKYG
jgi:hypothetical protein